MYCAIRIAIIWNAYLFFSCGQKADNIPMDGIYIVKKGDIKNELPISGKAYPVDYRQIFAPKKGVINEIYKYPQSLVRKDEIIAKIIDENGAIYNCTSPVNGYIISIKKDIGDLVRLNDNLIALVGSNKSKKIIGFIDEIDAVRVKPNQKCFVTVNDSVILESYIKYIDPISEEQGKISNTTQFRCVLYLDDKKGDVFLYGKNFNISVVISNKNNVMLVPNTFLKENQNKEYVVKIKKGGTVKGNNVLKGTSDEINTEIVSGISVGDTLIK